MGPRSESPRDPGWPALRWALTNQTSSQPENVQSVPATTRFPRPPNRPPATTPEQSYPPPPMPPMARATSAIRNP